MTMERPSEGWVWEREGNFLSPRKIAQ